MRIDVVIRRLAAVALALVVAAALAACSGGAAATPSAGPTAAPSATAVPSAPAVSSPAAEGGDAVTIANFAFSPASITVAAGTTVTWTNNDGTGHTVTADDASFDSKTLASGATFSQAFPAAGTYAYHCAIHSSMAATVVVR